MQAYLTGLGVGAGLIIAIGSQNAFVLRQGIRGEHVTAVCLTCAISDALLIVVGVGGFRAVLGRAEWLGGLFLYCGAAFLVAYGARGMYSALLSKKALVPDAGPAAGLAATVGLCLAMTWLNPHVYLDTVFLIGTVSTNFPGRETMFAMGAVTASFLFFFALGHGAALLRPAFASPRAWRVLDFGVALTMWAIAAKLMSGS